MSDYPFESFVFYRSFREAIGEMSDEDKLETLLAICDYALYGKEPRLKGVMPRAVFTIAKPSIDVAQAKRASGKRGGRPPKRETIGFLKPKALKRILILIRVRVQGRVRIRLQRQHPPLAGNRDPVLFLPHWRRSRSMCALVEALLTRRIS